jgi:HK97 gp10 family phage protein
MADTVHIKGLDALQKMLDTLPGKLQKNVMRGALRAGARVVQKQAKANIHSVSGELARSIKVSTNSKGGTVMAKVAAGKGLGVKGKKPGNLPLWLEYGTAPHIIRAKKGGGLALPDGSVVTEVMHPGAAPHPFMRPALDTQAGAAVVAAAEYMKARLSEKHGLDTAHIEIEEA